MSYFPHVNSEEIKIQRGQEPHQGQSMALDTKGSQWQGAGGNEHNNMINTYVYVYRLHVYIAYIQSSFVECYNWGMNREGERRGGSHCHSGISGKCTGKLINSETRWEGWRSWKVGWVRNLGKQQRVDTAHGANESQDKQGTWLDFPVSRCWRWAGLTGTRIRTAHICVALSFPTLGLLDPHKNPLGCLLSES